MMQTKDYRSIAQTSEAVFRNVLRDMKTNRGKRPMGAYIPVDLETEATIEDFFEKYSAGNRHGKFTICDFKRPTKDSAVVAFEDVACLSGGGVELEYLVNPDESVQYRKPGIVFRSLL